MSTHPIQLAVGDTILQNWKASDTYSCNWSEPERAPYRHAVCEPCPYVCLSVCMYGYVLLKIHSLASLCHQWIQISTTLINFNDYDFKLNKDRDHLWTYLFQWQQQWGLLRDSKDSEKFQTWWHECFLSVCQWLQRWGLATPYTECNNTNGSNTNQGMNMRMPQLSMYTAISPAEHVC